MEGDVNDNLTKMIVSILKPNVDVMKEHFGYVGAEDEEEGKIEERITEEKAHEYLGVWKKLKIRAELNHKEEYSGSNTEPLLDTKINDELYIETGEDVEDIFAAFKHYNLKAEITNEDRSKKWA